ncbi:AMP-binding protein [Micromonospora sp. NPDC049230]|uniref:AMP-binding protein n=1 Tax=Micromonospora sp. NPDC049230 TaxID=3155502 RepID=UPI003400B9D0
MTVRHLFTIHALLHDAAETFGDDLAVSDGTRSLSFVELRDAALATAAVLVGHGVRRGDRVGVCMAKSVDQAVAILAVLTADAVIVPILPTLRGDNIRHIVRDSGMRTAITDTVRADELRTSVPALPLLLARDICAGPGDPTTPAGDAVPQRAIGGDLAGVIYSSGSTGRPKGIMVTHRNLCDGARITARYLGTRRDDRIGSVLSLNFDYGLNQLWQALYTGAQLHLHELVFPANLFRLLAAERITVLPVMPVIVTRMFDPRLLRQWPTGDLSAVRYVSSSGGAVSRRMVENLTRAFPAAEIFLMYGLTEAFRSTYLEPEQLARRPTSIGRAIPDVEILVLDERGREVGPNEAGELVHRGGCIAKGYWGAPEETAKRFRTLPEYPGETVVFSGDIVTRDEEGYLYFQGRRDAMIKTSGFRVSPTEVEEIAARFPGIDACVAVGVPNVEIGEDIALVYTVSAPVDPAEFRRFLGDQLPSHMVPHRLVPRPSLPATGNQGKIDRQRVRDSLLDGPDVGTPTRRSGRARPNDETSAGQVEPVVQHRRVGGREEDVGTPLL